VALRNNGKELEAEEACRKAIRLDPRYEEAYFNLGVVLKFDRPSETQALFRKAIELDQDFAPAHRELGFVLIGRGPNPEAESHLRKAVELAPRDSWARIYLGTYLWQSAQIDAAIAEFRTASELEPKWAFPLVSLGNIYERELKDLDSAQSFYERALQLEPKNEEAQKKLALLHIKRNDRFHADNI